MVSDYQAIRKDNIRRRGEDFDDIGKLISADFYGDETHFIFELLQNTEDALAQRHKYNPGCSLPNSINFQLFHDRLEVRHFGQPFNEDDVRGISDVLRGTKKNDDTQIGRFGIGFKSVYAFTSSPEVHSGDEHFCIERYIRPCAAVPRQINQGETLLILPFNHESRFAEDIFQRISGRLSQLSPRTLLFLHRIDEISWSIENKGSRVYDRQSQQISSNCHKVTVSGQIQEDWLIFEKQIEGTPSLKVEIAFHLDKDKQTRKEQITPLNDVSPLVVFLPTEIETKLKFLIQGPYRTTPARDNILRHDKFNINLIEKTAELVAESLLELRDDSHLAAMKLLTIDFFNSLPIRATDFPREFLFYPIFEQIRQTLKHHDLLPTTREGEYISATQAKLARSSDLRQLISEIQLQELYGNGFKWLTDEITERGRKTSELYIYLQGVLEIEEIEPEDFSRKLSLSFLEKQSNGWMSSFYAFLEGQKALWREGGILRNRPFIRLQDNRHVLPFRDKNSPNAYLPLPPEEDTKFPTVKREIIENNMFGKDALGFLRNLGLPEPDALAEVIENVIPKYKQEPVEVSLEEHIQDLQKIFRALNSVIFPISARSRKVETESRRSQLISQLRTLPFLQGSNAANPTRLIYKRPGELYLASPDLEAYFKGNQAAWFLSDNIDDWNQEHLSALGIRRSVKVICKKPDSDGHIIVSTSRGEHQRGLNGFDPHCEIDGLTHALKNPTNWKAVYIWNHLVWPNMQHIYGDIQVSTRRDFTKSQPLIKKASKMGRLLRDMPWLPDKFGNFHKPNILSLDELTDEFKKNSAIAERLGLKTSATFDNVLAKLPRKYRENLTPERLEYIIQNPEKIDQLIQEEISDRSQQNNLSEEDFPDASVSTVSNINYVTAFQEAFNRPGETGLLAPEEELASVVNPQKRSEKLTEQIIQDKNNEPSKSERFKKVQLKRWEGKNTEEVRGFLREAYGGKCQICSCTFPKRNGEAYFEGVYIVSYTGARWIDRPGNVLCLCPNCCAKFQYGAVEIQENILELIQKYQAGNEGGSRDLKISINLCGNQCEIRFHEQHMLEIQSLLNVASSSNNH